MFGHYFLYLLSIIIFERRRLTSKASGLNFFLSPTRTPFRVVIGI
jgi:hypothetical protein